MGARFEFRILGPLEVSHAGTTIQVRSAKQRILIASLLIEANRVVGIDALIGRMWNQAPPSGARTALQNHVMRLRRLLSAGSGVDPIATRQDGYLIEVADGALDLHRFQALLNDARAALAGSSGTDGPASPATIAALLRDALGEWRGEPLADVGSDLLRQEFVPALEEQRLTAVELRVDAELRLGKHDDVITDLTDLTARYPLRERFWAQRMIALYRAGREAEALDCYRTVAELLADQLGVDPGPELRELNTAVLTGTLDRAGPAAPPGAPAEQAPAPVRVRRSDLPGDIADFAGREAEIQRVLAALPSGDDEGPAVVISAIDGMAGIGKTALAVHMAHQLTERYPDAQLFIDLHGHTEDAAPVEPAAALDSLLRALGVPGARIPETVEERAALWRAELADRKAVVVLDNAESAAQVRPLLPGGAGCIALITSRRRLTDLDTAHTLSLDVLPPPDARALFTSIVGRERANREPSATEDVLRLCGYLPLAIRIAAARLRTRPAWTVGYLVDRLSERHRLLTELTIGDRGVASAFALSYRDIPPDTQRLFRLLGVVPADTIGVHLAASVVNGALGPTESLLEDLVDAHLLTEQEPGRYRFHDLLRRHANATAHAAESPDRRRDAIARALDFYLHTAVLAAGFIDPRGGEIAAEVGEITHPPTNAPRIEDRAAALAWCDTERANLIAATAYAAEHGRHTHAWAIPRALWYFFLTRGHVQDWIDTHRAALSTPVEEVGAYAHAVTSCSLGTAYCRAGRYDEALDSYRTAVELYQRIGDERGMGDACSKLGLVYWRMGRYDDALAQFERTLSLGPTDDTDTLANIGIVFERLGRYEEAREHYRRALAGYERDGNRQAMGVVLGNLGLISWRTGDYDQARDHYARALTLHREVGDRLGEGTTLTNLGNLHRQLGWYADALDCHHRALALTVEIGERGTESEVLNNLGATYRANGQFKRARSFHERALALALESNDRYHEARARAGIAATLRGTDPDTARALWLRALAIFDDLGVPEAGDVRRELGQEADGQDRTAPDRAAQERAAQERARTTSPNTAIADSS